MIFELSRKLRGMGLSLLWSGLLLGSLMTVLGSYTARPIVAAGEQPNDDLSTIEFGSATYVLSEGVGSGEIVLLIDPPSSTPITVTASSASIQAEAGHDFIGLRDFPVVSPGTSTYTLSLTIIDDTWVERDEQLRLSLGNYGGALAGTITETIVTIEDNDIAYLSISDITVSEEAGSVDIVITQSVTSTLESLVDVRTLDGSATSPTDFTTLVSTTAIISPGESAVTVTVLLSGDSEVEGPESFIVQLEDATNAQLATQQATMTATVTLLDDDVFPEIEVSPATANEKDRVLPFVATLSSAWPQTVTVAYATVDGSATAPADYLSTSGTITIPPGSLSTTILVALVEDQITEQDETLYVHLTSPVQVTLREDEIEGIIIDRSNRNDDALYMPSLAR